MEEIIKNYNTVLEQIRISADEADRNMDEIKLIIVTKKFDVESIKPLLDIGHLYYGENRVQEAKDKWPDLINKSLKSGNIKVLRESLNEMIVLASFPNVNLYIGLTSL